MKKVIGYAILVFLFGGFGVMMSLKYGVLPILMVYVGVAIIAALIGLAVHLITD